MKKILSYFLILITISCSKDPVLYTLTTSLNPIDGGTISSSGNQFEEGETVTLNAIPSANYNFFSWTGSGLSGSNTSTSFVMDSDKSVTALFTKKTYALEIVIEGEGEVDKKIIKSGISTDYNIGTIIELSAKPAIGWDFQEWKGDLTGTENKKEITINGPKKITAIFKQKKYSLNIEIEGQGRVEEKIIKPGFSNDYISGTVVELTAIPEDGWLFLKWSGDLLSFKNPVEITVDMAKSLRAEFYNPKQFTGLPLLYINTDGISIDSKEEYVNGTVSILGGEDYSDLDETEMKIKGRGNSTWWQGGIWGKKPYQIKFGDKTEVLNIPEDKKWVLLAELSDKSMIRNKITREMGKISRFNYVPRAEYTEVFINNVHAGTYLIGQKVEESKNRVNIGDDGYLIEIDQDNRVDEEDVIFKTSMWEQYPENLFNIKEPSLEVDSDKFNLIKDHVIAFESALKLINEGNFTDYKTFIDLPSFVDWFLISEISKNVDSKHYSSIYFNYVPGEKIKMGPLWDFDLAYGNIDYADPTNPEGFWVKDNLWYKFLFKDPYFHNLIVDRFGYYESNMSELFSKIDSFEKYLEKSQKKNFEIWPILGQYVWPNPVYFDTHHEEVEHLKDWIDRRMAWLKANL
jgi:hypothetical protein